MTENTEPIMSEIMEGGPVGETHRGRLRQAIFAGGLAFGACILVGLALFKKPELLVDKVWTGLFAMLFLMAWIYISDDTFAKAWDRIPEIIDKVRGR